MMNNSVWARVRLLVCQGVATMIGKKTAQATILGEDDVPAKIKRIEPYGFSYRPHTGTQAYLVFPDGDRSYGLCLVIGDEQYNMDLEAGEVAIHDDKGNHVHLKRGGIIEAKASTKVIAETPLFETSADAEIGGNLTVKGQAYAQNGLWAKGIFEANGKNVSESHTHFCPVCGCDTEGVN